MICSLWPTVDDVCCDLPVTEPVLFHGHITVSAGNRSFSAAGPRVWNALAQEIRQDTSFG